MPIGIYNHRQTKTPIYTKERNQKISETHKGMKKPWAGKNSPFKKGHSQFNTGRTHFKKGNIPWCSGKRNPYVTGEKHPKWLGDKVNYRDLHNWVVRWLGQPDTCSKCGKSNLSGRFIHWANKSGKYLRDLTDWIRLCSKCHGEYDSKKL